MPKNEVLKNIYERKTGEHKLLFQDGRVLVIEFHENGGTLSILKKETLLHAISFAEAKNKELEKGVLSLKVMDNGLEVEGTRDGRSFDGNLVKVKGFFSMKNPQAVKELSEKSHLNFESERGGKKPPRP